MVTHLFTWYQHRAFLLVGCFTAFFLTEASLKAADGDVTSGGGIKKFVKRFCIDCHSNEQQEGEREFETFALPIITEQQLITADEMIDQLTLKLMPPEEAAQPTDQERLAFVGELRNSVRQARDQIQSTSGRTVIRRLSNREYENTLAALFGRRVDTLGLTANFPKDDTSDHIDTIGDSLVMSGFLLDQYFQAASRLVETRLAKPQTKAFSWSFVDNFRQYEELTGSHKSVFNFEFLCLYEQPNTDTRQGGYGHIEDFLDGVPVSGLYRIEVHAQAMHRDTHYDPNIFRIDFSEPFQLAIVPGDVTKGHIHYPQAIEPILGVADVPDENPQWITFNVWLEAGQTPRFIFPNGPYESRASVIEINRRYKKEFKNPKEGVSRATLLREGALPHIRIGKIKVHGPIEEAGGGKEEQAVFGNDGFQAEHAIEQLFSFAKRAYRRPLEKSDCARISDFYQNRLSEKATPREAALDTLKMILCSPAFLYLSEITPEEESELSPLDLASRLSYALWAAPPDDELLAVAESKQLLKPEVLRAQSLRLLGDNRSSEFVDGFLDNWLDLRDIGNLPPPRKAAPEYYAEDLPESMKQEARLFFQNLLENNGPVSDFLDADYTFVDKKLAKLYGLPEKDTLRLSNGFQRVSLAGSRQRGGLLGMAGVLTVSANGVDTSPVTRGVWVLENLLGITPPPPPDEVPAIDANVSDAKSIREKLALHSQDKACSVCHRNIDPLGYALETFDPIGRWRSSYPKGRHNRSKVKIDPSGQLPSGETYQNFTSFKQVLRDARLDPFMTNLIETMLAYAAGREMEQVDQFEIEEILSRVKADNYGLQTMVIEVLASEIFRSR